VRGGLAPALNAGGALSGPTKAHAMNTCGNGTPAPKRPRPKTDPARAAQAGQSGEGARSALELLQQQETRRRAQLPREDSVECPPDEAG
jgi:hypothetical protein